MSGFWWNVQVRSQVNMKDFEVNWIIFRGWSCLRRSPCLDNGWPFSHVNFTGRNCPLPTNCQIIQIYKTSTKLGSFLLLLLIVPDSNKLNVIDKCFCWGC
jgi:hypothetical protein